MTTYFIDSENVQNKWSLVIDQMESGDIAVVSYSDKCASMPLDCLDQLLKHEVIIEMSKCYRGNNAMDFQISTDLGYRIARNSADDKYVIVSNDHGYDPVVRYWSDRKIAISRKSVDTAANKKKTSTSKPATKTTPAVKATPDNKSSNKTSETKSAGKTETSLTNKTSTLQSATATPKTIQSASAAVSNITPKQQKNSPAPTQKANTVKNVQNPAPTVKTTMKKSEVLNIYRKKICEAGVEEALVEDVVNAMFDAFTNKNNEKDKDALGSIFGGQLSKRIGSAKEKAVFKKLKPIVYEIYKTCYRPVAV